MTQLRTGEAQEVKDLSGSRTALTGSVCPGSLPVPSCLHPQPGMLWLQINSAKGRKVFFLGCDQYSVYLTVREWALGPSTVASSKVYLLNWALNLGQGRPLWLEILCTGPMAECKFDSSVSVKKLAFYFLLLMKWRITFLTNILFLILFTPLCCFIVFLTMPSASLQESVFWKWNASHPEASLDGIHYWFGADDGCSGCLWLPEPLRAFLLQDNNKQQNARKNPRTGSILWLCMPGTSNRIHTRASPFSSISLGYCGILFDTYFTR